MHQVQVGEIALVRDRAPGAGNGAEIGGNDAGGDGLLERFAQKGREQIILLAGGLDVPFAVSGPILVGLRVRFHLFDEAALVDSGHREHHRCRHHLLPRRLSRRRSGAHGDIRISRGVDDPLGEDRLASGFALGDHAADGSVANDRHHEHPVQHRLHPRLLHQDIGDVLEHLRVQCVAVRLRLRHRRSHGLGALLELDADSFAVDGAGVAVPGETFHSDLSDIAAKTAVSLEQRGTDPGARGGERRCEAGGPAADDQHLGFGHHVEVSGRFADFLHGDILTRPLSIGCPDVSTIRPRPGVSLQIMSNSRMEAFSDGVIAVIITILVLDLKVPHGESFGALLPVIPVFLSYVLSFLYVGIYWNNHHHMLHASDRVSGPILWANLHLLFWLSLFPFATAWMGENHFSAVPTALYGAVLLMAAAAYWTLQQAIIASQGPDSLLKRAVGSDWKGKLSPVAYLIGIAAAFWSPRVSQVLYTAVAALWLVPDRRIENLLSSDKTRTRHKA